MQRSSGCTHSCGARVSSCCAWEWPSRCARPIVGMRVAALFLSTVGFEGFRGLVVEGRDFSEKQDLLCAILSVNRFEFAVKDAARVEGGFCSFCNASTKWKLDNSFSPNSFDYLYTYFRSVLFCVVCFWKHSELILFTWIPSVLIVTLCILHSWLWIALCVSKVRTS